MTPVRALPWGDAQTDDGVLPRADRLGVRNPPTGSGVESAVEKVAQGECSGPPHELPAIHYLPRRGRRGPPQTAGYRIDPDTGCWNWTGAKVRGGYGGHGSGRAHRVAWELLVGAIPEGHDLHHLCGNRLCVNPEHLEPRLPREHRGRNGKLSEHQLDRILELIREGRELVEIANDLGVDYLTISGLKLGGLFRRVSP